MSPVSNRRRRDARAGVAAMEVAASFGVLIVLIFGLIDFSLYFYMRQQLTTLAAAAARMGPGNGQFWPCGSPPTTWNNNYGWAQAVNFYAPSLDPDQVTMCVIQPLLSFGVQTLTVTASYTYTPFTPGLNAVLGVPMSANVTYQY